MSHGYQPRVSDKEESFTVVKSIGKFFGGIITIMGFCLIVMTLAIVFIYTTAGFIHAMEYLNSIM